MSYPHGHGPFAPHHGPHPTHIYYNHMRRGPTRLIWFSLGGLATYWFIESRERKRQMISQGDDQPARRSCMNSWSGGWGGWGDHQRDARQMHQRMEEEQRRMRGFGQSASETIVDMTESSLDSVMASVVALKAKLADQRAANQAARKAMEDEPRQV